MRPISLLSAAALFIAGLAAPAQTTAAESYVEIERSTPSASPVHLRKDTGSQDPAERTSHAKSQKPSNFNFDGGWDGNRFHFNMNPGPKALIQHLWFAPFQVLSRGRMVVLWMALSLVTAALFQPYLRRAEEELRRAPGRSVVLGLLWSLAFWALLAACAILCLVLIGVPLMIVLVAFHLILCVFGMTITFSVVGEWIAQRINHSAVSLYVAILVGACSLGLLRMLPVFGWMIWFVAGAFGTGAALAARFGIPGNLSGSRPALHG